MSAKSSIVGDATYIPRVDGSEKQPVLLQRQRDLLHVVEEPSDFEGGEVRGDGEAAEVLEVVGRVGVPRQPTEDGVHGGLRARVQPQNGVVQRLSRHLVPHDRCLSLGAIAENVRRLTNPMIKLLMDRISHFHIYHPVVVKAKNGDILGCSD